MGNDRLAMLIKSLYDTRKERIGLEAVEQAILTELMPLVDPKFDELPDQPIVTVGVKLTRVDGTSRTISADKLLERGVSPDIVQYATKTTKYHRYVTSELGKEKGRGK